MLLPSCEDVHISQASNVRNIAKHMAGTPSHLSSVSTVFNIYVHKNLHPKLLDGRKEHPRITSITTEASGACTTTPQFLTASARRLAISMSLTIAAAIAKSQKLSKRQHLHPVLFL